MSICMQQFFLVLFVDTTTTVLYTHHSHCLLYTSIFGNGQMENIPIGIVDQDNTATSRTIARNISAVPTFKVTCHFTNEAAAREAVQRKEIYGYLSIPHNFEQDATTGNEATLSYYYHYALLSVGGELMAAFETSLAPVALSPIACLLYTSRCV